MGRTIRSAKMKLPTPPKLIPPRQSTAASGTLPTEHTNDRIATRGPTSGPSMAASVGLLVRKKARQNVSGTQAASTPSNEQAATHVDPDRGPIHHEVVADCGEATLTQQA